jgi:hypothetical protein
VKLVNLDSKDLVMAVARVVPDEEGEEGENGEGEPEPIGADSEDGGE